MTINIVVIGSGYVGLVSGSCFAELGFNVTCVDKDRAKIEALSAGVIPIYEPGLDRIISDNQKNGRLHFTTDLAAALSQANIIFIAVGTPSNIDSGEPDLSYLFNAANDIKACLTQDSVIVIKSTVPVGTTKKVAEIFNGSRVKVAVTMNPEFLREGQAVYDFMNPVRIVVGSSSLEANKLLGAVYQRFAEKNIPVIYTAPETAEIIKYASNTFLAAKIAFINEIADICEIFGGNIDDVALAMGLDDRIGNKFLQAGPGFGGSCFPKDIMALAHTANTCSIKSFITDAVIESNNQRKQRMAEKILAICGGSISGKNIACLGLTFKAGTDDIRESPAIAIIESLMKMGAKIRAYDPAGLNNAKKVLQGNITWCVDSYEAAIEADALVILTEWLEFSQIDFARLKPTMRQARVIDLRNILAAERLEGFEYHRIGTRHAYNS